jgi:hypothetical protein
VVGDMETILKIIIIMLGIIIYLPLTILIMLGIIIYSLSAILISLIKHDDERR